MADVFSATAELLDSMKDKDCVICDREIELNAAISFTKNWQPCHANCYRNALMQAESSKYLEGV